MNDKTKNPSFPEVSVIIPTYNRRDTLPRAIESVLEQTYKNFEIIIVDDASTDDTQTVLSKFKDERIRCMRLPKRKGAAFARNEGIRIARGKFIAFQDSDDEWLEYKLERQLKVFFKAEKKVGVVYSDMWFVNKELKQTYRASPFFMPRDGIVFKRALAGGFMNLALPTAVVRRECFEECGLFDENMQRFIDLDLFIRISKYYCFYHINKALIIYHESEDAISTNKQAMLDAQKRIFSKYYQDIITDKHMHEKYVYEIGTLLCQLGSPQEGRGYLIKALKLKPFKIKTSLAFFISFFGSGIYCIAANFKKKLFTFFNKKKKVSYPSNHRKKTILYITHAVEVWGAEISLLNLIKHIDKAKFQIIVGLPKKGNLYDRLKQLQVMVELINLGPYQRKNPVPHIRSIFNIYKLIKKHKADILHSATRPAQYYCLWAARMAGIISVCSFHDIVDWREQMKFSIWSIKAADCIIAASSATRECLLSAKINPEKITVIRNIIDAKEYKINKAVNLLKNEYALEKDVHLVGIIGRLVPEKGLVSFIKAAGIVFKEGLKVKFFIVGEEPLFLSKKAKFIEELKTLVNEMNLTGNVVFTGFREDIPQVINSLDVLVIASWWESLSLVAQEAMALSKPVVATNVGGIPEIVEDNITGILVPAKDENALAQAISDLVADENKCLAMGRAGFKKIHSMQSFKEQIQEIEGIYNKL